MVEFEFEIGDIVIKTMGDTEFIGEVIMDTSLSNGQRRIMVRNIVCGAREILHIYAPKQFRLATDRERNLVDMMNLIWLKGIGGGE